MCLIVFSYKNHPKYDLVFAANRDEFYKRPAKAAQFWDEHPHILAGKDLSAGGTWMGVTKNGFLSALTNYRDPSIQKNDPPSRGHLVLNYLIEEKEPESYIKEIDQKADQYNGFNLVAGHFNELAYYSNQQQGYQILNPGVYGLSNHLLDTPWPKVKQTKNELSNLLEQTDINKEQIFNLLIHDQPAPEEELPDTGIPKEIEKAVSPPFIKMDEYGTRSSTVLLITKSGEVIFEERRFKSGSQKVKNKNQFKFNIET
ncbi:MAG: NRDE family protein [Balneolaceae bacterium]|nr:NRDE family protein [Balneolaceae bacterium]